MPATTTGNSQNFGGNYTFTSSATLSLPEVSNGDAVIAPGSYLPAGALSAFNGQTLAGNWSLSISDNASADTGALQGWSLNLTSSSVVAAVPEPGTWAMMIIGFGAAGASLRRRKSKVTTRVAFA